MAMETTAEAPRRIAYTRTELYPKQEAALFDPARYSWTEATVKSGKTSGCVVWLGEKALAGRRGQNFSWFAPIYSQAKIAFDRTCEAMTREIRKPNLNELRIDLLVGTHMFFRSADNPNALYGEDNHAAVVDECSRMKEEAWHAIRSTLTATQGPVRLIGNVRGRRNWFYRECRRAEAAGAGYHKLTWRDAVEAGILDIREINDARLSLPPTVFRELFEAEASDDEGNPFGLDNIRACVIAEQSRNPIAAWGWDLAKRHDWTYGVALDASGREVRTVRFQAPWRDTKRRIAEETKGRPALVDATGVGDPVLEDLQAAGGNFEGFVFTSRTKQQLMENLAIAFQHREVGLTDRVLIAECESFEYVYKAAGQIAYSAPDGAFDDGVCALALAKRRLGARLAPFVSSRVRRDDALVGYGGDDPAVPSPDNDGQRIGRGWGERELTM